MVKWHTDPADRGGRRLRAVLSRSLRERWHHPQPPHLAPPYGGHLVSVASCGGDRHGSRRTQSCPATDPGEREAKAAVTSRLSSRALGSREAACGTRKVIDLQVAGCEIARAHRPLGGPADWSPSPRSKVRRGLSALPNVTSTLMSPRPGAAVVRRCGHCSIPAEPRTIRLRGAWSVG